MMNNLPPRSAIERVKKEYPAGTRVELVQMDDPYSRIPPGTRGTVRVVDDIGTIFVSWENGSSLGVVYGVDIIKKVNAE